MGPFCRAVNLLPRYSRVLPLTVLPRQWQNDIIGASKVAIACKMATTLKDISREAGVDVATVSRALNGSYGVHKATRERVIAVAKRLNYRANLTARELAIGKSHTLGLLVPDIGNPFVTEVVRGAEDAAYAAGYHILLCNSYLDSTREAQYMRSLLDKRVEGILMHSVQTLSNAEVDELSNSGIPVVLLCRSPSASNFSGVCVNHFEGGTLAGEHLMKLGHRKVAFLSGPRDHGNFIEQGKGFIKAVTSVKDSLPPIVLNGPPSFEGGYQLAQKLLDQDSGVTAIFAANDVSAFGIARAIFEAGLSIPEDISLIGFNNVELANVVRPPLTTIHQPKYEMGQAAVEILLGLARSGRLGVPEQREFGVRLLERSSTSIPPKKAR
jgi:LacI family transcriptional regulator